MYKHPHKLYSTFPTNCIRSVRRKKNQLQFTLSVPCPRVGELSFTTIVLNSLWVTIMARVGLVLVLICTICQFLVVTAIGRHELLPYGLEDDTLQSDIEDGSSSEIPLSVPVSFFGQTYRGIYVNTNGILSFVTDVPNFYNNQFPMDYPIIAPLYSDVDTRGKGTIYYRGTTEQAILHKLTEDIQSHFSVGADFTAVNAFIATWEDVGYYDGKQDKVNNFQVAIATDGRDSYAVFLYVDNGITWIQSEGKTPGLPDARAQAGIMSGDGRMYSLHGSGSDHVQNLDKLSNVGIPGVWWFRIGRLLPGESIGLPDIGDGLLDLETPQTCALGSAYCHTNAACSDFENGFCCSCLPRFQGNGYSCLEEGIPQRLNGKVKGILNGEDLTDLDLHSYIVTTDGRAYTAISKTPQTIGYDMQALVAISSGIGWLFAVPRGKASNGFQLTGGILNRTVEITFPQTGHSVRITQHFLGVDVFNYLRMNTDIQGTAPIIIIGAKVEIDDYDEEYTRIAPGTIRSQSSHNFRLEGNNLDTPYRLDQVITYEECPHAPIESEAETLRLKVSRSFIVYDSREQIVRYATNNKITTLGSDDPCKEGRAQCGPQSSCVVDGDTFRCVCDPGFEYLYEEDASGERATCIDINECSIGRDNCHTNAECINHQGSFSCRCSPGFVGNGVICERTQTCADLSCDTNAECIEAGSQQPTPECRCFPGFNGNGHYCVQSSSVEDCRHVADFCSPNAACVFSVEEQVHVCECLPGYIGSGVNCEPQEVSCNVINNCHPMAQCIFNTRDERYECRCNSGFHGDGFQCTFFSNATCDVVNTCSLYAKCVFDLYDKEYRCLCNDGYEGDGISCVPKDECSTAENCSPHAECIFDNQELRHRCRCLAHFVGNGKECTPASESCNVINHCHPNARCVYDEKTLRFYCQCQQGFVGDGLQCTRGRSCSYDPYLCDQNAECVQVNEQEYECQCEQGFTGDGFTCTEAPRHEGNFLLVSQGLSVVRLPSTGKAEPGKPVVMRPLQTAVGVDIDCLNGHFYWADVAGLTINRAKYDGSNVEVIIQDDITSPEGVAVDWVSRNIFWTDSLKDTIEVARIDGENRDRKVLINTSLDNPRGIAVHPSKGRLFWSDWNRQAPKIESSNLDGSDRKVVISNDITLPNAISLDYEQELLCWADAGTKRIECSGLDGQDRRTIVSAVAYPFGLTQNKLNFFYTDWETRKIEVIAKIGGQVQTPLEPPLGGSGKLYGIVSVPDRCPKASNLCAGDNGGCINLCLPKGATGRTCACPDDNVECNEI